jgi:hypothetical protein
MVHFIPIVGLLVMVISSSTLASDPVPGSQHRRVLLQLQTAVVGSHKTEAGTTRSFFQTLANQRFICTAGDHTWRTLRRARVECKRGHEIWAYEGGLPISDNRVVFDRIQRNGVFLGGAHLPAYVQAAAVSATNMATDSTRPASDAEAPALDYQTDMLVPDRPLSVVAKAAAATVADTLPLDCTGLRGGQPMSYRNPQYGFGMTYPSTFALDPESVPENGDSARFWTTDRNATVIVTGLRNRMRQPLSELLQEAKRDVVENSRGTITYERARDGWFVLSGFVASRIYYQRTILAQGGSIIATLWIEFPRHMRPCFDRAVSTMSHSFRAIP